MINWLNELRELIEFYERHSLDDLPWDSVDVIRKEYNRLLDYMRYHYTLTDLGEEGWTASPKLNWRRTCIECGSVYVIDGMRCGMCHDGL